MHKIKTLGISSCGNFHNLFQNEIFSFLDINLFQHNLIPHVNFYKNYCTNNTRIYPKFSALDLILNFWVKLNLRSGETAFVSEVYLSSLIKICSL